MNRVSLKQKLNTLFVKLPYALIQAARIFLHERPDAVLGVGGYASFPCLLIGILLRKKSAVLEQNRCMGMANRTLARFVDCVFASFPDVPGTIWTGNPVRSTIHPLPSSTGRTLLILGGSQGARGLNAMILRLLPKLTGWHIMHQTGRDAVTRENYEALPFFDNMQERYAAATIVISRAGASTIFELARVGRAAILVPLPTAADNHQEANALYLVEKGAAKLVHQDDDEALLQALDALTDDTCRQVMEQHIRQLDGQAEAAIFKGLFL